MRDSSQSIPVLISCSRNCTAFTTAFVTKASVFSEFSPLHIFTLQFPKISFISSMKYVGFEAFMANRCFKTFSGGELCQYCVKNRSFRDLHYQGRCHQPRRLQHFQEVPPHDVPERNCCTNLLVFLLGSSVCTVTAGVPFPTGEGFLPSLPRPKRL